VSFKREVFEGEAVIVSTEIKETAQSAVSKHQILSSDKTVCVIVQIEWKKLD
jgi:acyl-CoA thioesterase FadM